jgi:DNA adenine methylase
MVGPLSYIGGKNRLAKQIIQIFPKHTTYVEAFAGGAQVLFHKDPPRAARYLYLLENSFASIGRSNHRNVVQPPGFNLERLPELIENAHKRLERVQIECSPYDVILKSFDRPTSLFYLDPPYWGKKLYRHNFTTADFEKLEECLRKLRGKFVLSRKDLPEVRTLFHRFHIQPVELHYTAQQHAGRRYREVLITNFQLPKVA